MMQHTATLFWPPDIWTVALALIVLLGLSIAPLLLGGEEDEEPDDEQAETPSETARPAADETPRLVETRALTVDATDLSQFSNTAVRTETLLIETEGPTLCVEVIDGTLSVHEH